MKELTRRCTIIHHGPETQPRLGPKGGVSIVLSPDWIKLWRRNENKIFY